ncbi:MAG: hypothetical protein R6V35_02460 [Candidatus Nanohaloarchaea archaeon]
MKAKSVFLLSLIILTSFTAVAQTSQNTDVQASCTVLEAQNAEIINEEGPEALAQDMEIATDQEVSVAEDGGLVLVCDSGFMEVPAGEQGVLEDVMSTNEELETDLPETEVPVKEALNDTEQIEENLDQVNQVIDEALPDRIAGIILGDDVNFQIDNTTIGIETNSTGVTDVQEGGFENPDLHINMDSETIQRVMESENPSEEFTEAYNGEGIDVEAYSFRNKVAFGVVNTGTRVYGFVTSFF